MCYFLKKYVESGIKKRAFKASLMSGLLNKYY